MPRTERYRGAGGEALFQADAHMALLLAQVLVDQDALPDLVAEVRFADEFGPFTDPTAWIRGRSGRSGMAEIFGALAAARSAIMTGEAAALLAARLPSTATEVADAPRA